MFDASFIYQFIDSLMGSLRHKTIDFGNMQAGESALDVCCGVGSQVLCYARTGLLAYGVDLAPGMISAAKKKKRKQGLDEASFHLASALALPFNADSFDHVSITLALHEKERQQRDEVIAEMRRVSRRGGTLLFLDYSVPLPRSIAAYFSRTVEYLAGGAHYTCFRDYVAQGGLVPIMERNRLRMRAKEDFGPLTIISAEAD